MKTILYRTCLLAALGVGLGHVETASAQIVQTVKLIGGVELRQGKTVDKKGVTTTQPPTHIAVTTKTLLEDLAKDETLNGTWFAGLDNKVPAGTKLEVEFAGPGDFTGIKFKVAHGADTVDVSNIMSATTADTNGVVVFGYVNADGANHAPFYTVVLRRYTLSYDARPMGDALHFAVTGMGTTDSVGGQPNANGEYLEGDVFGLGYGTGGGVDSTGTPFFLENFGIAATGKGTLVATTGGGGGGGGVKEVVTQAEALLAAGQGLDNNGKPENGTSGPPLLPMLPAPNH